MGVLTKNMIKGMDQLFKMSKCDYQLPGSELH